MSPQVVPIGVPQGSTLGPLLFLLYVNDLPQYICNGRIAMFADDTVLYCSGKTFLESEKKLQQCLNNVSNWYDSNRLSLNTSKSHSMLVASSKKFRIQDRHCLSLQIKDINIQQVRNTKYLGITIDDELKWSQYVTEVSSKLTRLVHWFRRLSKILPVSILQLVYKTCLLPVIDYACSIWGSSAAKYIYMIQRLQNNAARAVCKNYDYINIRGIDLVKSLNWMTVKQRIQYFTVTQMFKCIHRMAQNYLSNGIIVMDSPQERELLGQDNTVRLHYYTSLCVGVYGRDNQV